MNALRSTRAAFSLVALTWFLLVFGSTVRVHGAGLACPDWPLCFGRVVPAYDFKVYLEFGHRVVAGFVSLGFIAQAVYLWRSGAFRSSKALRWLYPAAAAVLATQVVLGGLTVLELLAEWTVSSHLLAGNAFCTMLLLIALSVREWAAPREREATSALQRALPVALGLGVLIQLVLGGLVSSSYAGLACSTWPTCNGHAIAPTFEGLVGLQVVHRLTAYGIGVLALANLAAHWSSARRAPSLAIVALVLVQIVLGVTNVMLYLPMEVTLLHSAMAAAILLATGWLGFEAMSAPMAAVRSGEAALSVPMEAK